MYLAYLPTVRCDVMLSPRSECHRSPPPSEGFLWQLHLIIITVIVIVVINVTIMQAYHLLITTIIITRPKPAYGRQGLGIRME